MGDMSLRVVLVDADQRFRAMACRALAADGVEVVAEVENGEDAFDAVTRWRPDVVLLDIRLPGIDGLEVARLLRAEDSAPPVILISTLDVTYGRRVAVGLAAGFLPKNELSLAAILEIAGLAPQT
jgi:CheY-like chemotaxis protein